MGDEIKDFQIKIVTSADLKGAMDSAKALQDISNASTQSAKEQVRAAGEVEEVEKKAFTSKVELRNAAKGLQMEFPLLSHVARLALNPITLVVTALASAWNIWTTRVAEATRALAGVELPDISPQQVGQVTAMAEAWNAYREALVGVTKEYNSVEGVSKRSLEALKAEADQAKRLLEARKGLELAALEQQKSNLSPGEYIRRKLGIDDRYAAAGIAASQKNRENEIYSKSEESYRLREDAARKFAESKGIKVGTAEQDAKTEADLKAQADAAQTNIGTRQQMLADLYGAKDMVGGFGERLARGLRLIRRYGASVSSPEGLDAAIEQENVGDPNDRAIIESYNAWLRRKSARGDARKRKMGLIGEAGAETGRASVLDAEVGDEMGAASTEFGVNRQVGNTEAARRATAAAASIASQVVAGQDQERALREKVAQAFESRGTVNAALLQALEAVTRENRENAQSLQQLRGAVANQRNNR